MDRCAHAGARTLSAIRFTASLPRTAVSLGLPCRPQLERGHPKRVDSDETLIGRGGGGQKRLIGCIDNRQGRWAGR